jgi:hypothetical protein
VDDEELRYAQRLLIDPHLDCYASIAETPVDEQGDEERNVRGLRSLVK